MYYRTQRTLLWDPKTVRRYVTEDQRLGSNKALAEQFEGKRGVG